MSAHDEDELRSVHALGDVGADRDSRDGAHAGSARTDEDEVPRESVAARLRMPTSLAVGFIGTAACVALGYAGCHRTTDPPMDTSSLPMVLDGDVIDADLTDGGDDAGVGDASSDGPPPDTPIT